MLKQRHVNLSPACGIIAHLFLVLSRAVSSDLVRFFSSSSSFLTLARSSGVFGATSPLLTLSSSSAKSRAFCFSSSNSLSNLEVTGVCGCLLEPFLALSA